MDSKNKIKFIQRAPKLISEYLFVQTATFVDHSKLPVNRGFQEEVPEQLGEESNPKKRVGLFDLKNPQ